MPEKVSVIIVNHNTKDILAQCLNNIRHAYSNLEVTVIDSGSTDNSVEIVKNNFSWVKLISTKNIGISAGYNLGISESSGRYYLFLGSDVFPEKNTINGMVDYLEKRPRVGIATCKLLLRDGRLDMDAHRGFPTPWTSFTHFSRLEALYPYSKLLGSYYLGYKNMSEAHEIDLCISHFMFMRKEVILSVGEWDEDFFVYGEDVDMCYRAKQEGWKVMYLPQWSATHYKGVSVGIRRETQDISRASTKTRQRMKKETTEAMIKFYTKHYVDRYPKLVTWAVLGAIRLLSKVRNK